MNETDVATASLAGRLRSETTEVHEAAERAAYVQDLMAGRLPVTEFTRLVRQHAEIYRTLERLEAAATEPTLQPFLHDGLHRSAALEADLNALAGPNWAEEIAVLDATRAYCEQIEAAFAEFEGLLLAHHYVRYLGDLSGGQIIGRVLQRTYGFEGTTGTEFYRFDAIESPKAFKEHYRESLDTLPWDAAQQDRLVAEVIAAYAHNTAIFHELSPLPVIASEHHDRVRRND